MSETAAYLRAQATKCRGLSKSTLDERVAKTLRDMALEYDERAALLEAEQKPE